MITSTTITMMPIVNHVENATESGDLFGGFASGLD